MVSRISILSIDEARIGGIRIPTPIGPRISFPISLRIIFMVSRSRTCIINRRWILGSRARGFVLERS